MRERAPGPLSEEEFGAAIFGSKSRYLIGAWLSQYGTQTFTIRQVAEATGVHSSTVYRQMQSCFVYLGFVDRLTEGEYQRTDSEWWFIFSGLREALEERARIKLYENYSPSHDRETWYEDAEKSIAFVALHGAMGQRIDYNSTTAYEVVTGEGRFCLEDDRLGDEVVMYVKPGSKVVVPVRTVFRSNGDMTMLATSTPPFDSKEVDIL